MRVLISGASGLIGSELADQLNQKGHEVFRLVRRAPLNAHEVEWHPEKGFLSPGVIDTIDAVVNLAGATTGRLPWTKRYKKQLVSSRLDSTKTLVHAIRSSATPPKVLISGSASGFYGDRADELLDESATKGFGFLSDLSQAWEQEALQANDKTRVVLIRTSMVMSRRLGALGRLLPLIKLGIGGALGTGKQWWAWITLPDEVSAIIHLIETESASGVFNLTAPQPATCKEIVQSLAKSLRKPAFINVPKFALKILVGEAAQELLLGSQKMVPSRLEATGFKFRHANLTEATNWVVNK